LKDLGQYVIINTVVTKTNYKNIPQIAKMLADLDIEHFQFSFIHIMGRAWENRNWIVPRKSEVIPYINEAIDIGIKANKRVTTEAIPYCLMRGYENSIVESLIPKSKVFELDSTIEDLKAHRIYEKKIKRKECIKCKYYRLCEGPWKEYPELFGWDEFEPIRNEFPH
jgi:MoaA/NifB/PqqE/SkfB family radical SAM enzyme